MFQNKDKLEKLRCQAETFCHRLGRYRMPFAWATVNIMDFISTPMLDRDVTDSDSLKGGVCVCLANSTAVQIGTDVGVTPDAPCQLFQVNPAALTGEHSFPGGILNVSAPLMISFATCPPSSLLASQSLPSSNRFVSYFFLLQRVRWNIHPELGLFKRFSEMRVTILA